MHYLTTTVSKESFCWLISFCLAHNPSLHFCIWDNLGYIWDILVPLLSPGYLGTIPSRPIFQEQEFVYLLPTRLKLSWNTLHKELVGSDIPMESCCSRCWLFLLGKLQIIAMEALFSAQLHISLGSASRNISLLSLLWAPRLLQGETIRFAQVFLRWIVYPGRKVDLTWILDLKPVLDTPPATSWNIPEIL